jgi:hypothetical protein
MPCALGVVGLPGDSHVCPRLCWDQGLNCPELPHCVFCRGTYFARSVVSRSSPLIAQLQLPRGIPALLVAKHCALLGKAHTNQFGGADIWDEEVRTPGPRLIGSNLHICKP